MDDNKNKEDEEEKKKKIEAAKKELKDQGYEIIKNIGQGKYGLIVDAKKDNNIYAVKIIISDKNNNIQKEGMIKEFRGKNLVRIIKEIIKPNKFAIYIMEKSFIGNLTKSLLKYSNDTLLFKEPFLENFGDNLIRFFAQQIFSAIKTLNQGNLVHFDIKPDNILIFKGLELKFIDFSFLKKCDTCKGNVPGGTFNFFSPENFQDKKQFFEDAILKKQDIFAAGITLYFLKYSHNPIIGQCKDNDSLKNYSITMDCLQRAKLNISSYIYQDKDFTEFLTNLIDPNPEKRLDLENILRNKWLNKNTKSIKKITNINFFDEDCLFVELQKSDFLINNRKYFRKNFDKRYSNVNNKKYKQIRKGKFKFGKRNA